MGLIWELLALHFVEAALGKGNDEADDDQARVNYHYQHPVEPTEEPRHPNAAVEIAGVSAVVAQTGAHICVSLQSSIIYCLTARMNCVNHGVIRLF